MRKRKRRVYSFISYLLAFTMTFSTLTPFAEAEENTPSSANVPQAETTEGDATVTPNVTENGGDNPSTTENVEHTEDTSTSTPAETSEVEPVTSSNTEQEPASSYAPLSKRKGSKIPSHGDGKGI